MPFLVEIREILDLNSIGYIKNLSPPACPLDVPRKSRQTLRYVFFSFSHCKTLVTDVNPENFATNNNGHVCKDKDYRKMQNEKKSKKL